MSEDQNIEMKSTAPAWTLPAIVLLGLVAAAGLVFGWKATSQLDATKADVAAQVVKMRQGVDQDLTAMKSQVADTQKANTGLQSDLNVVTKKLRITQGQLKTAREEAAKLHEDAAQKIDALGTSVKGELATKASADELKTTNGQVTEVRGDLDTTKKDLQMAKSEFGTLIARNHEEVEELRRKGERDYVEFTLNGKSKPEKIGNITVEIRGVNEKKNQFSIALTVEDKRYEKKNRSANEPIFFYIQGARLPEELVVNKVAKNKITGYLSIPKANQQPAAGAGS
jgi:chromosome segregation ATPase